MATLRLYKIYIIVVIASFALFLLLYLALPTWRINLFGEDRFLENLTAVVCFITFIVGAVAVGLRRLRWASLALATVGLVAFLDEISFGSRLLGFQPPRTDQGMVVDGVHDLPLMIFRSAKPSISRALFSFKESAASQVYGVVVLGIKMTIVLVVFSSLILIVRWFWHQSRTEHSIWQHPIAYFVATAIGLMVVSQLIDTFKIGTQFSFFIFLEEFLEIAAAMGLMFATFTAHGCSRKDILLSQTR